MINLIKAGINPLYRKAGTVVNALPNTVFVETNSTTVKPNQIGFTQTSINQIGFLVNPSKNDAELNQAHLLRGLQKAKGKVVTGVLALDPFVRLGSRIQGSGKQVSIQTATGKEFMA